MPKLTLALAKQYVRALGGSLKRDIEWEEYILRIGDGTYHTDSLEDAIGTARVYFGSHPDLETAERILNPNA
jgi:hypothetical protein